jgi:hypothetical protein
VLRGSLIGGIALLLTVAGCAADGSGSESTQSEAPQYYEFVAEGQRYLVGFEGDRGRGTVSSADGPSEYACLTAVVEEDAITFSVEWAGEEPRTATVPVQSPLPDLQLVEALRSFGPAPVDVVDAAYAGAGLTRASDMITTCEASGWVNVR